MDARTVNVIGREIQRDTECDMAEHFELNVLLNFATWADWNKYGIGKKVSYLGAQQTT